MNKEKINDGCNVSRNTNNFKWSDRMKIMGINEKLNLVKTWNTITEAAIDLCKEKQIVYNAMKFKQPLIVGTTEWKITKVSTSISPTICAEQVSIVNIFNKNENYKKRINRLQDIIFECQTKIDKYNSKIVNIDKLALRKHIETNLLGLAQIEKSLSS